MGRPQGRRYVVRWYTYDPRDDTVDREDHIATHFMKWYWDKQSYRTHYTLNVRDDNRRPLKKRTSKRVLWTEEHEALWLGKIHISPSEGDKRHSRLHALTHANTCLGMSVEMSYLNGITLQFVCQFTSNFERSYLSITKAFLAYAIWRLLTWRRSENSVQLHEIKAQNGHNTRVRNDDGKDRQSWMMYVKCLCKIMLLLLHLWNISAVDEEQTEKMNNWISDI